MIIILFTDVSTLMSQTVTKKSLVNISTISCRVKVYYSSLFSIFFSPFKYNFVSFPQTCLFLILKRSVSSMHAYLISIYGQPDPWPMCVVQQEVGLRRSSSCCSYTIKMHHEEQKHLWKVSKVFLFLIVKPACLHTTHLSHLPDSIRRDLNTPVKPLLGKEVYKY